MLYPTELRGQMAIFDYFSEYSELFYRFLFSVIPDSAEFHFRQKVRIFAVFIFQTFSKGDRSNYHLGGECSIQLSYGGKCIIIKYGLFFSKIRLWEALYRRTNVRLYNTMQRSVRLALYLPGRHRRSPRRFRERARSSCRPQTGGGSCFHAPAGKRRPLSAFRNSPSG